MGIVLFFEEMLFLGLGGTVPTIRFMQDLAMACFPKATRRLREGARRFSSGLASGFLKILSTDQKISVILSTEVMGQAS